MTDNSRGPENNPERESDPVEILPALFDVSDPEHTYHGGSKSFSNRALLTWLGTFIDDNDLKDVLGFYFGFYFNRSIFKSSDIAPERKEEIKKKVAEFTTVFESAKAVFSSTSKNSKEVIIEFDWQLRSLASILEIESQIGADNFLETLGRSSETPKQYLSGLDK